METKALTLRQYQDEAHKTSNVHGDPVLHAITGLPAEVGEFMGLLQKYYRGDYSWADLVVSGLLKKELGDVLWYLAEICTEFDLDLEDVGLTNLAKLRDRMERNVIAGSGDER